MGLAEIYLEAAQRALLPSPSTMQSLWNEWLWGTDCNAMIDEDTGDMNSMHILGIHLALLESIQQESKDFMDSEEEDKEDTVTGTTTIDALLPFIPLVHLYKKPITEYTLRELTNQVIIIIMLHRALYLVIFQ